MWVALKGKARSPWSEKPPTSPGHGTPPDITSEGAVVRQEEKGASAALSSPIRPPTRFLGCHGPLGRASGRKGEAETLPVPASGGPTASLRGTPRGTSGEPLRAQEPGFQGPNSVPSRSREGKSPEVPAHTCLLRKYH